MVAGESKGDPRRASSAAAEHAKLAAASNPSGDVVGFGRFVSGPRTAEERSQLGGFARWQARYLAFFLPGQWCCLSRMRRARTEWVVTCGEGAVSVADVVYAVAEVVAGDAMAEVEQVDEEYGRVVLLFFTPTGYTDRVQVVVTEAVGGKLHVAATSHSAGTCTAKCPGSPLFAILFAWMPFHDHGVNILHLRVRGFYACVLWIMLTLTCLHDLWANFACPSNC